MKNAALNLIRKAGAFEISRLLNRNRALILTYHRFDPKNRDKKTAAAAFAEQLQYLKAHYRVVSLSYLAERLSAGGAVPNGLAVITIDDGYRDSYEIAYPLLRKFELPAVVYVVPEFVDRRIWLWTDISRYLTMTTSLRSSQLEIDGAVLQISTDDESSRLKSSERINDLLKSLEDEHKEELLKRIAAELGVEIPGAPPEEFESITWEQALEMERGGIEIGSHTLRHPIMTRISASRSLNELVGSKSRIEEALKRKIEHFCYPNGDYNADVKRQVEQAGYRTAVTCVEGLNKAGDDLFSLRRVHTDNDLIRFMQSTSGFEHLKNNLRKLSGRTALARPSSISG